MSRLGRHGSAGWLLALLLSAGWAGAQQAEPAPLLTEPPRSATPSPGERGDAAAEAPGQLVVDGDAESPAGESPVLETAVAGGGAAGDPAELVVRANTAYEEGDYEQAVALYRELLSSGADNGFAHYNLGNALLRNGQLGPAIASYRRALVLQPRNQDARANLAFARRSARDALVPPEPSALSRALFFWHYALSTRDVVRLGAVLNVLFWLTLGLLVLRRHSEALRWLAAVLGVLVLACVGSLAASSLAPARVAVVVPQEVDVFSGTDRESVVRFKLHAGTEVRMAAERGDWLRIELPDGQQGWIEREHAEVVVGR